VNYVSGSDIFKVEAIVDKGILEFYINDGELYYVVTLNGGETNKIEASVSNDPRARGGKQEYILKKLEVQELNSIWNTENTK
jgi:hypothetical protein